MTQADGSNGRATRERPLRVVMVEIHGTGGLIHYGYQLADGLSKAGASVTLITSSDYELADLPHSFEVRPVLRLWPHHETRSDGGRSMRARARRSMRRVRRAGLLFRMWFVLARSLPGEEWDVALFGHLRFPFEGLFLSYLRRRGLLLADVCHEVELRERSSERLRRLVRRASRRTYRQFAAIFVHGEANRAAFCQVNPEVCSRVHAIPIGNEALFRVLGAGRDRTDALRRRYMLRESDPVALFFGNITPSKGLDDLIHAHAIVRSRLPSRLVIAGYPSKLVDVGAFSRLSDELGVSDSVAFDFRYVPGEEVGSLMELATVVVLPYRSASQSAVLQVAFTYGKPVVVTRVGALPEVVEEGVTGLLVAPRSPRELAGAMEQLLADGPRARAMGRSAHRVSEERHAWTSIARSMLAVYERLVAERGSAS